MNWWQHALVALAVGLIAAFYFAVPATPLLLAVIVVGGLAPDVDHHKAKAFKALTALLLAGGFYFAFGYLKTRLEFVYALGASVLIAGGIAAIAFVVKPRHRGITHSLLAVGVFTALVFILTNKQEIALLGGLAYFSHLAADLEIKLI